MLGKFFAPPCPISSDFLDRETKKQGNEWAPFSETGLNCGKVEQPFS